MNPEKLDCDGREKKVVEVSDPSFHGRLLKSAIKSLPDHRKRRLPFKRPAWTGWPVVLGRLVGQGAIFAGGLLIGGGVMMLRRGEPLADRPGMMIVAGVAFVLLSILSNLLAKESPKPETSAARG
jgi:hypothetical protein